MTKETPRLADGSPDWSAIGRRSKRKGKTYERKVAGLLQSFTNANFRKVPSSGGFNKQGAVVREESFCGDVICDRPDFKFCIEAKNRETFSFQALLNNPNTAAFSEWWYQCIEDAKSVDLLPILFFKPEIGEDLVALTGAGLEALDIRAGLPMFRIDVYAQPVSITQLVKVKGQKKKSKIVIEAQLPTPFVISWKTLIKHTRPEAFFRGTQ